MSERAKQIERLVSLSIIALLIIGSIVLVLPFLPAILWAVVFAVTTWPFFIKVEKSLGGRTSLAAAAQYERANDTINDFRIIVNYDIPLL